MSNTAQTVSKSEKFLTFLLGEEEYGLEILKVQEIIQMQSITRVPHTPHFVRGVINLRGKVIPIIDMHKKFEMETVEDSQKTCIVVVQVNRNDQTVIMGVVIDEVRGVADVLEEQIDEAPDFGDNNNVEFLRGMGKIGQRVCLLLDIDKVLSDKEMQAMSKIES